MSPHHNATRWYCRYLEKEWDTALRRSYDIAVHKRDVFYTSAKNDSSYKNLIQGNIIFLKRRTITKEGQCISVNDRGEEIRKLAKRGGVPKKVRKLLSQKFPNTNGNTEIEIDVNITTTTKRRSSNVSKENKNNKRRRSVTTKARALEPSKTTKRHASHVSKQNKNNNNKRRRSVNTEAPALKASTGAGGSCTHCLTLQKLMEKQTKQLSHAVKELAALRQHVKDHTQEVTNVSTGGLRAFVTLEIGSIRTKLDMHTNLLNRVLSRGQKHTKIMQILCDQLRTGT